MNIIDTHSHLYSDDYKDDLSDVVARAVNKGVTKTLLPNIDEKSIESLKSCVNAYPDFFLPMMGLHPTSVGKDFTKQLELINNELKSDIYIAVGEIGIDLYWDKLLQDEQTEAFEEQLRWSIELDLPVSIHFRDAAKEVVKSIKRVGESKLRGVFHSFGGTKGELEQIMELKNFMIGVNGVITFKNSGLAETLKECPTEMVVLETDSPYLSPMPFRGKRNESAYLLYILKRLSEVWQINEETVAEITTNNAKHMFAC